MIAQAGAHRLLTGRDPTLQRCWTMTKDVKVRPPLSFGTTSMVDLSGPVRAGLESRRCALTLADVR